MFRKLLLSSAFVLAAPVAAHAELYGIWNGRITCGLHEYGTIMMLTDDDRRRGFIEVQSRDDHMPDLVTVNYGAIGQTDWIAGRASLLGRANANLVIMGERVSHQRMNVTISGLRNCTHGWFVYGASDKQMAAYRDLLIGDHPPEWYRVHRDFLYRKQLAENREAHRYPAPSAQDWKGLLVAGLFACQLTGCFNGTMAGSAPTGGGSGKFDPDRTTGRGGRENGRRDPNSDIE